MKITIAMDSFKGSLSASKACQAVALGVKNVYKDCTVICAPISDGGEGLIESLYPILKAKGYVKEHCEVIGPYLEPTQASFLYHNNQAVIEMAQCSGLTLAPTHSLNGALATTYGLGQLVDHVIGLGCHNIMIGLGGSATNEAGVGFAQALGAKFYDKDGKELKQILNGQELSKIASVDSSLLDAKLSNIKIEGTCDVINTLCGPNGATYIFGPQKGILDTNLKFLDNNLRAFARLMDEHYHQNALDYPGSGAAGGMGAALLWFGHGKLTRGIEVVMDLLSLHEHIKDSDLVIVGEGRIDGQSLQGKAPVGVAKLASQYQVPVIALCGSIGKQSHKLYDHNISALFSLCNGPMSLEYAMEHASELLTLTTTNIMRLHSLTYHPSA